MRQKLVKLLDFQENHKLEASRQKDQITYKRKQIKLSSDFPTTVLPNRRKWRNIVKILM